MKFRSEEGLVNVLKNTIEDRFDTKPIKISKEVSLGFGIADMVVSTLRDDVAGFEMASLQLGAPEINIFTLLEAKGSLTLLQLIEITRIDKYRLKSVLKNLIDRRLIELQDDKYIIIKGFELTFKFNLAIEAKLKDWKRALKQAYRYLWFAEYSYVVMDEYYCKPAIEQQELFEQYNVGLASINDNGEVKRYYTPVRQKPFDITMQRLFSEKLRNDVLAV